MKINLDSPPEDVRIEIVPLLDVIFCILTFFILATLQFTRQQAISVDLPKATTSTTTPQAREMLLVSINPFNQIYVGDKQVVEGELEQKLREYRQQNPQGTMVLYASKTAFYNDVVQVLDKMRSVGGDRVALATLPDTPIPDPASSSPTPGLSPNSPGVIPPGLTPPPTNPFNPYNPSNPYTVPNPQLSPTVPDTGVQTPSVPPSSGVPEPPGSPTPETSVTP